MRFHNPRLPWIVAAVVALFVLAGIFFAPRLAAQSFGTPDADLDDVQRVNYSIRMLVDSHSLTTACDPEGQEQIFVVQEGEPVDSIASRLEAAGIVCDGGALRDYLVWSGMDRTIQTGSYRLSPAWTGTQIARALQDATPAEVTVVVYPGWRLEEIAASLPTTGLEISPQDFVAAASLPVNPSPFLPAGASAEGFLAPGEYVVPRTATADQLVSILIQQFTFELSPEIQQGFTRNGLGIYQAVILASIIERETVLYEEMPTIASVFFNRLRTGMHLQSDPTVQYAIGFTDEGWWKNPLRLSDLEIESPYNTYLYPGLPPAPISNPSLEALEAVAFPEQTDYYFFVSMCDGSGFHNFAETFDEHLENLCP
ncbi:MAG: endolytic transglycosylase MltG [Anaerolineales bacterium]|nr:endolytic transglycosylase MltG [Anaerolineales bacterium]